MNIIFCLLKIENNFLKIDADGYSLKEMYLTIVRKIKSEQSDIPREDCNGPLT